MLISHFDGVHLWNTGQAAGGPPVQLKQGVVLDATRVGYGIDHETEVWV